MTDLTRVDAGDGPNLGPEFWARARLVQPISKDHISLRLDHDVLMWFRDQGRGYQTRINTVLRSYMEARRKKSA